MDDDIGEEELIAMLYDDDAEEDTAAEKQQAAVEDAAQIEVSAQLHRQIHAHTIPAALVQQHIPAALTPTARAQELGTKLAAKTAQCEQLQAQVDDLSQQVQQSEPPANLMLTPLCGVRRLKSWRG